MTSCTPLRLLRFPYNPHPDESAIGAFVAACRQSRQRSIVSALEGGRIALTRPGSLQIASADELGRAASVMRTDPALLEAIAFRRIEQSDAIAIGGLEMPRVAFTWSVRRIAPKTLAEEPYHRSDWLNLLLPFCPVSLELLVSSCSGEECGPLGWRHTRGIAECEHCGSLIPPADQESLPVDLVDEYRHFADLVALNPTRGAHAVSRLPTEIQSFSRTTLVRTLLRAGMTCRPAPGKRINALPVSDDPVSIARIVCEGMRILRDWPRPIQAYADHRMSGLLSDTAAYNKVRADLRRIAGRDSPEGELMLATAFPSLDGRKAAAITRDDDFYPAAVVNSRLWTSSAELKHLREAEALRFQILPSNERIRARYNADDVDALRALLQDATSPNSIAALIDLPVYAIGQIVAHDLLSMHDHPGVVVLRGRQIKGSSLQKLGDELKSHSQPLPEVSAVTLRAAMMRYGGEKPWASCLMAMLSGRLPYQLPEGATSVRRAKVSAEVFATLDLRLDSITHDPLGLTSISLRDAQEVLCLGFEETARALTSARIPISSDGRGKAVDRLQLRQLASQIAATGEAAARQERRPTGLYHELTRLGVPRLHEAWSRAALAALGMVETIAPVHE